MLKFLWALGAVIVAGLLVYLRGRSDGKEKEAVARLDEKLDHLKEIANVEHDSEMARAVVDRVNAFRERVLRRTKPGSGSAS